VTSLQAALDEAIAAHPVPGAVVGTLRAGAVDVAAAGVRDVQTREAMTADTAFLTGSITKVWATVLAMTLVDEGALDLSARIVDYAPQLRFGADERFASAITVEQLLNHSSGTDAGDLLRDTGSYPDGIPAYLELLARAGHLHRPGEYASYNNAGWLVLEEVLRHITGQRFDALLLDRVVRPLRAEHSRLHLDGHAPPGTAVGHFPEGDAAFTRTPQFLMPGCLAAAGTNLLTTVEDTLRLLECLMVGGGALLSRDSAARMCTPTIADPPGPESGFALGWRYRRYDGVDVLWHGGGSYGGYAVAAMVRESGLGVVSYANSGRSMGFHAALLDAVLGPMSPMRVADAATPMRPGPGDLERFAGRYDRVSCRTTVEVRDDRLAVRQDDVDDDWEGAALYRTGSSSAYDAVAVGPSAAVSLLPVAAGVPAVLHFVEPQADGRYALLYLENRLARRAGSPLR
jgi:CubicO group peptidase (beta-lactamase class C family)